MLLQYNYLFGLLEQNYFTPNGLELNDQLEHYLKGAIVYAVEEYLTLTDIPYTCVGHLNIRKFAVTQPYGDVIKTCQQFHRYGSLGNGLIKTWLYDLDDIISRLINKKTNEIHTVTIRISRSLGIRVTCQFT